MFRQLQGFVDAVSDYKQQNTQLASGTTLIASDVASVPGNVNRAFSGLYGIDDIDVKGPAINAASLLESLKEANKECAKATKPQDLINLNQEGTRQCGWYYNLDKNRGVGFLTDNSTSIPEPINIKGVKQPKGPYQLYFGNTTSNSSLQAAQEQYDTDFCNKLKECNRVLEFPGCGYCKKGDIGGIPIDKFNNAKYSNTHSKQCEANQIVTNSSQCPVQRKYIPPRQRTGGVIRPAPANIIGGCNPDPTTGRLTGACLQSTLQSQGCDPDGGLYTALNGFTAEMDIASIAKNNSTINLYAENQQAPFQLTKFLTAKNNIDAKAFALALATDSDRAEKIPFAKQKKADALAIDLCQSSGYFLQNYDFCSELAPSSQKPSEGWDLSCLQKAFLNAGLTVMSRNGNKYPRIKNDANHQLYNSMTPWKKVTDYMDKLYKGINVIESFIDPNDAKAPLWCMKPFSLQLVNFPERWLTYNFAGQVTGNPGFNSDRMSFSWSMSKIPGYIQIHPWANKEYKITVDKWRNVICDNYYTQDSIYGPNNNFDGAWRAVPGLSLDNPDADCVSFQFCIIWNNSPYPIPFFLCHSGFRLYMGYNNNQYYFKRDASFRPMNNQDGLTLTKPSGLAFFQPKEVVKYPEAVNQDDSIKGGMGVPMGKIPPGYVCDPFTNPNQGIEVFTSQFVNGLHVITGYSVQSSLKSVSAATASQIYTIANYYTAQPQIVSPSVSIGVGNTLTGVVEGYITEGVSLLDTRIPPRESVVDALGPFKLFPNRKTLVKLLWKNNGGVGSQFGYSLTPATSSVLAREPEDPVLRFEPFSDPAWTGNKYIFTESRMPETAFVSLVGTEPRFQTAGTSVLKTPGTKGYAQFNKTQIYIPYVDLVLCSHQTFCFSITHMPPCTKNKPCNLLKLCNRTSTGARINGYECVVYGSTNGNISFAIQQSEGLTEPVTLTVDTWYVLSLTRTQVQIDAIDPIRSAKKQVAIIPVRTRTPVVKTNSRLGPLIQIGDASTPLQFNVAWLHLFHTVETF